MTYLTTTREWWNNLAPETQDRLARDPSGPVPIDLREEVRKADGTADLRSPFVDDHRLRAALVMHIHRDNAELLAEIVRNASVSPFAQVDELRARARRRGLMS